MLDITKRSAPMSLLKYVACPEATYAGLPKEAKQDLRKSLLEEQHFLCAYCMCGINEDNMKIEHFKPQSDPDSYDLQLDYNNLFAVCDGREGKPYKNQTCDSRKGDGFLSFSLIRGNLSGIVSYDSGTGKLLIENYQREVDNILNLNDAEGYLLRNRRNTLDDFKKKLHKEYYSRSISRKEKDFLRQKILRKEKRMPYAGIIDWYLSK